MGVWLHIGGGTPPIFKSVSSDQIPGKLLARWPRHVLLTRGAGLRSRLMISTKTFLIICHELVRRSKFCRITLECQRRIGQRVGHATKRCEAATIKAAERNVQISDELSSY
jgi:hypothetical protein